MALSEGFVSPTNFKEKLQPLFSAIFTPTTTLEDGPFQDRSWDIGLIPYGIHLERKIFNALKSAAIAVGDETLILVAMEDVPEEYRGAVLEWDYKKFDYLRSCTLLGHINSALFGDSQRWGITAYHEDYACIGGSPEFMDNFTTKVGGRDVLKTIFLKYAEDEWLIGGSDQEKERKLKVLARVGWLK